MKRESDMTAPLLTWLEARGYVGYCEVPHYGSSIDLVGWNEIDDALIVIEMKRALSATVIHQACLAQTVTRTVFCAVASKPRKKGIAWCREIGLGILRVASPNAIQRLLSPQSHIPVSVPWHRRMIDCLREMQPGGIAGVAHLAGCGPAQDCERAIAEYRAAYPRATWREVWEAVPNHYAHARSMQSAMRMVRERRAWKDRAAVAERMNR